MRHLALLLLLALLAPSLAAEETVVTDDELEALEPEFHERMAAIGRGELKAEVAARYHQQQVESAPGRRKKAIARFFFGRFLQLSDRKQEAEQQLALAVEDWPDFPACHVFLAALVASGGDLARAEESAKRALAIDPEYVRALVVLGNIALLRRDFAHAKELFDRGLDIDATRECCQGLVQACVELRELTYLPKEKEALANRATAVANGLVQKFPKAPDAHLFRAHVLDRLGQTAAAAEALEKSYEVVPDDRGTKLLFLRVLRELYEKLRRRDKVEETLERMLARKDLDGPLRERCEEDLRLLREKGEAAFGAMRVKELIRMLENEGLSASERREYLRWLLDLLTREEFAADPLFEDVRKEVGRRVLYILKKAPPPELMLEMLRFFRQSLRDPALLRILVFYVYPEGDARTRTPEVRAETVRTIASICGQAALPTLLHCLQDDSPEVAREVDKALSDLFGVRSRAGGDGISPLTPEQLRRSRVGWRAHSHSPEGAALLSDSVEEVRKILQIVPERSDQRSRPLADHVGYTILLDNDMPFGAWAAAYAFLVDYLGRDSFRPPERRGRPVTTEERPGIVAKLSEYWRGGAGTRLEEDEAGPAAPPEPPESD
jgi:tetratricopeptide (TPR) repeat protein